MQLAWLFSKREATELDRMKSFVAILCLVAVSNAQWQRPVEDILYEQLPNGQIVCRENCRRPAATCPPVNCPVPDSPVWESSCSAPDCSTWAKRQFLYPYVDPNYYYECAPFDALSHRAILRRCACGSVFNHLEQRCVHAHEFVKICSATTLPVVPRDDCPRDCPTCDDLPGGTPGTTTPGPTTPAPTTPGPTTPGPTTPGPTTPGPTTPGPTTPGTCQCPCVPCIWWPCTGPCTQLPNCPCTNQQQLMISDEEAEAEE